VQHNAALLLPCIANAFRKKQMDSSFRWNDEKEVMA